MRSLKSTNVLNFDLTIVSYNKEHQITLFQMIERARKWYQQRRSPKWFSSVVSDFADGDRPFDVRQRPKKLRYTFSQTKDSIIDVIHDWVIEIDDNMTMKAFFAKIENYIRLHRFERIVKKELLTIFMKSIEIISELYHRIFKLWKLIKIFYEDKMNQFQIVIKFVFVKALLSRRYTDMKLMFEMIKKVEN